MRARIVLICVSFLLVSCLSSCYTEWMPTEGIWYCQELQMQISFEENESFVVIDNQKVACACLNDRGSAWFFVLIQGKNDRYPVGTEVFSAKHVQLSKNEFIVSEEHTGQQYVFTRVPQQ